MSKEKIIRFIRVFHVVHGTKLQSPIYDIRNAAKLEGSVGLKHPSIPLPLDMYGTLRKNSKGY
ncbi:hypothetical protein L7829_017920, partial [Acinetobacter baumannii]|nr:hypothetical protein [Acinetobacter baumannii]